MITSINEYRKINESADLAADKAKQLFADFNSDYNLAYKCTEEIVMGLYDFGIREPEYWYEVQRELDKIRDAI